MKLRALWLTLGLLAPSVALAAAVEGVSREVTAGAAGSDCSPDVADERKAHEASTRAGRFRESADAHVELNRNDAGAESSQESIVDESSASFVASGHAEGEIDGDFDEIDYVEHSFLASQGRSRLELIVTLERQGLLQLDATLTAQRTGSLDLVQGWARVTLYRERDHALVWEQSTHQGPAVFLGAVPLAAGRYRLVLVADAELSDASFTPNTGHASASFAVRGRVQD